MLTSFNRAVFVLPALWKPDCTAGNIKLLSKYWTNCETNSFLMIYESDDKVEMGSKSLKLEVLRLPSSIYYNVDMTYLKLSICPWRPIVITVVTSDFSPQVEEYSLQF